MTFVIEAVIGRRPTLTASKIILQQHHNFASPARQIRYYLRARYSDKYQRSRSSTAPFIMSDYNATKTQTGDLRMIFLPRSESFIFLGITINNKLNWNSHINKVTNKISKTVGILNKLRSFLPSDVLQTIYNTLILPHLIYGILAWGRHTNAIHKIQKRAIRIIAASKYNAHTEPLLKQLHLLKACDICKLQELKFYHKLINRHLPKYFECFVYQTNLDLHNYNTRRGHRLHIPRINHAFAQLNIRHSVIQTVHNMPDNVIDKIRTHNLKGFSTYAKNYFISTYETTCEIANCYVCQQ